MLIRLLVFKVLVKFSATSRCVVDLLHLFDATYAINTQSQFLPFQSNISVNLDLQIGVACFTDKPVPFRGRGDYGNYQGVFDYCYWRRAPLTPVDIDYSDSDLTKYDVWMRPVGGGDTEADAPFEGLIRGILDPSMNWRVGTARSIVVLTTDSPAHLPPAASSMVDIWNGVHTSPGPVRVNGSWGTLSFAATDQITFYSASDIGDYSRLAYGLQKVENHALLAGDEIADLQALVSKFGPYPYPPLKDHPGDNTASCSQTEYPSMAQIAKLLQKHEVLLIVMVASQFGWLTDYSYDTRLEIVRWYQRQFDEVGLTSAVAVTWDANPARNSFVIREIIQNYFPECRDI
eukprot:Gregarina_sp_Pseudo_9__1622@NODE_2092_length_1155_cov_14_490143_g1931_i0_p1_GENE_NODE_2092_length_1155_cov_14_490143_g1931_i0NODE_2092_length_1155_cov_14_490143_g1931_i0_p1_ORF_typecomplete_len346_score40_24Integrin_beta/PF00362_18/0_0068Integrin_beta/PF00362_18/0_016_NODE_2092_length_1155_cov_14_490143_g1931_i0801117